MRRSGRMNGMVLLQALMVATAVSCQGTDQGEDAAPPAPSVAVQTAVASAAGLQAGLEGTGSVEPRARVTPGSRIMGRVGRVPVEAGDRVRAGDLLVELDHRDLQAAVEAARAAVKVAEARTEQARLQHERMSRLHGRGSSTDKEKEDAEAAWRVQAALLEQARAQAAAAEVSLGHARITSPVDGWVAARNVEVGDMVAPGQPLFTLEDMSRVKVMVDVPEQQARLLAAGDAVTVTVDGLQQRFDAAVTRVLPAAHAASRTFQVEIVLDNPGGELRSGMFARALFPVRQRDALLVAAGDLVQRGALTGIFVVGEDDVARLRWLRLGPESGGRHEVLAGLRAGERYVVSPPGTLADGTPVTWE